MNTTSRVYTPAEVKENLKICRDIYDDPAAHLVFKNCSEYGQLLARIQGHPESEILVVYHARPGFQFPVDVPGKTRYQRAWDFGSLFLLLQFYCKQKLEQAQADEAKTAELAVVDVKCVGNCRWVYTFNRELSDAEFDAYGRRERLQPYISPCGYVLRKAANAFLVDESTD